MNLHKAFKFQLKLKGSQERQLVRFAGCCRFVWNKALALQKERFEQKEKLLSYAALTKELTGWRRDPKSAFLEECNAQALQQSLKDLDRAYINFFEKRGLVPKFKKKGFHDSFRYPQGFKLDEANNRIFLQKLGWVKYRNSQRIKGTPKQITISRKCGKSYISISTVAEVAPIVHPGRSMVGIDLGVARFATLSDGVVLEPLNSFKKHEIRLARLQRDLSKQKKFGKNWMKQKQKVGRMHEKIANIRKDYLQKASTTISKKHAVVVIEDLRIRNMSGSAAGTLEKPGRNVKGKSGLNKAILDQGWFEFRRELEYKQTWRGGWVIAVLPHGTSQKCSVCGHQVAENRKSQEKFECMACGQQENADLNGAKNILAAGHAVIACGEAAQLGPLLKQEPTKAIQAIA